MIIRVSLYHTIAPNGLNIYNSRKAIRTIKDAIKMTVLSLSLQYPRFRGYLMLRYPRSVEYLTKRLFLQS